jgi:class 3 adenylate cyclase
MVKGTIFLPTSKDDHLSGGILIPIGIKPWDNKQRYPLRRGKTTIGRAHDCDVRLNDPTVSRLHAELVWTERGLMLKHLSLTNPTLVNGVPVHGTVQLDTGDRIDIADGIGLQVELFGGNDSAVTQLQLPDTRRIYAILSADIVAYSRHMESDEASTARDCEAYLSLIRCETEHANGQIINVTGDGVLALFTSVNTAVSCAVAFQRKIAAYTADLPAERRLEFRVGINSGDVLIMPTGGVYGDAVNIAVRVQSLASPGGILVTGAVHDQLAPRDDIRLEFLRTDQLKNLSRDFRIYRVSP